MSSLPLKAIVFFFLNGDFESIIVANLMESPNFVDCAHFPEVLVGRLRTAVC